MYSDIENPEEVDISLPVPFHNPRLNDGHQNDFIDVFRKAFGGGLNGSNMTATFIDNGVSIYVFFLFHLKWPGLEPVQMD